MKKRRFPPESPNNTFTLGNLLSLLAISIFAFLVLMYAWQVAATRDLLWFL